MLFASLSMMLAAQSGGVMVSNSAPPAMVVAQNDRAIIAHPISAIRPVVPQPQTETLNIRISSPQGVLWQGPVRVSRNQGGSYQQSLSQASVDSCPPDSGYDRSERRQISFNIYAQYSTQRGPQYRVDVSWARPVLDSACGESGTRTVQINQTVLLEPGQTQMIEGDAGLKIEISRR